MYNKVYVFGWIVGYSGDNQTGFDHVIMKSMMVYDSGVTEYCIKTGDLFLDEGKLDESMHSHEPVLVICKTISDESGNPILKAEQFRFSTDVKYLADHLGERECGMEYEAFRYNAFTEKPEPLSSFGRSYYFKSKKDRLRIMTYDLKGNMILGSYDDNGVLVKEKELPW